ncbi:MULTISPECIES: LysR family transcriptional regulator [Sphingobium]|jgi:DNA-binding transcriptional LysR family regulator|uniref:LysR family transcriptional regulator n=1 Tax=Sphingobium fuliginis ATCC 27551 TaxID=1208342 RepID=A0A5B8CJU0_SPHSA|nr:MULTISPECIES: LysR family transcriptional regulator [Sphingobium]QDC39778.1 LysR family transcriptional regulator [Sphingobium fuliginis ATCC 27551]UXC93661.1 LysR family transcriptional regulator [Sphingobium sp. RSMS]
MDRLTGLEVFVAIVDSGSFVRAAERLALSPTMVSTHLARLEDRLGARLIHRTTRRFALTPQGHLFLEEARSILEAVEQAESRMRMSDMGPSGRVALDAPGAIGLRFVVPALSQLRALHPRIVLDLSVGDRSMMFRPEAFDLLIRVGVPAEGKGEVVNLGRTRFVQVASPDYLARRGEPVTPDDLHDHDCVLYATVDRPVGQWRFVRGKERRSLRPASVATFNHGDAIAAAAVAGVGIAQTLEMLVAPELASGLLKPVLTEWNRESVDVQLFIPQDRMKRQAVRAVAEFLQSRVDWGSSA